MLPKITRFCGPNTTEITINGVTLYFSYETLIGFKKDNYLWIRENEWNNTTGKHINTLLELSVPHIIADIEKEEFTCIYERISK